MHHKMRSALHLSSTCGHKEGGGGGERKSQALTFLLKRFTKAAGLKQNVINARMFSAATFNEEAAAK